MLISVSSRSQNTKPIPPVDLGKSISALIANQKPVVGNPGAKTIVIGFVDYQCPACRANFQKIWARVANDPNAAFYVEQMPLPSHPLATPAAEVALGAMQAGKFHEAHKALMGGDHLSQASIDRVVSTYGLQKAPSRQVLDELARGEEGVPRHGLELHPGVHLKNRRKRKSVRGEGCARKRAVAPFLQ